MKQTSRPRETKGGFHFYSIPEIASTNKVDNMSNIGLRKETMKSGRVRFVPVYHEEQGPDAHLADVVYYLESPDRVAGGRDDVRLQARCGRDLLDRAHHLREQGRYDLALNFAFGAAVMGGVGVTTRERSLSLYRSAHKSLSREKPDLAHDVLEHHRAGQLWAAGVTRSPYVRSGWIDERLHLHFRAKVHEVPLKAVRAEVRPEAVFNQPPGGQIASPDQRAVA